MRPSLAAGCREHQALRHPEVSLDCMAVAPITVGQILILCTDMVSPVQVLLAPTCTKRCGQYGLCCYQMAFGESSGEIAQNLDFDFEPELSVVRSAIGALKDQEVPCVTCRFQIERLCRCIISEFSGIICHLHMAVFFGMGVSVVGGPCLIYKRSVFSKGV